MPLHIAYFTGWSAPLAKGVASRLLEGRTGAPIDLGSHRVVVPSSFASRLIQEELAKLTSGPVDKWTSGQGILLPVFQTPTDFLNFGDSNIQAASSADALMAWIEVLQATNRAALPCLFPNAKRDWEVYEMH
jgi:hypothetical protein